MTEKQLQEIIIKTLNPKASLIIEDYLNFYEYLQTIVK